MLEYDIMKSPGLGAFLGAGQVADASDLSQAQTRSADASTDNTLSRLFMEQQKHPLEMQKIRTQNEGTALGNESARGLISNEEKKRRKDATDSFFDYLGRTNGEDVEGAVAYSGVPPKFGKLAELSPEERMKMAKTYATQSQKGLEEREKETARLAKQAEAEKAKFDREQANIRLKGEEERKALELKLQAHIRKAAETAQKLPKNFQEAATRKLLEAQSLVQLGKSEEAIVVYNEAEQIIRESVRLTTASKEAEARATKDLLDQIQGRPDRAPNTVPEQNKSGPAVGTKSKTKDGRSVTWDGTGWKFD